LRLLIDEIGDRACRLHGGPFSDDLPFVARYEIDHDPDTKAPEALILAFCDLVEGLSEVSRTLWDSDRERVIDLGYQGSTSRDRAEVRVSPYTLSRMAALRVHLAWTFYPTDEDELSPATP